MTATTRRRWLRAAIATVVVVGLPLTGGWLVLRWIDEGMSGVHISENPTAARHLAEGLGLQLAKDDRVVYGELQSSFPDSGSYLVVVTRTAADRDRLLAASSMSCAHEEPSLYNKTRATADHGPGPTTTTMMTCHSVIGGRGELSASYDPAAQDGGTRTYIQASEM